MPSRIEVSFKPEYRDPLGESVQRGIVEDLGLSVDKVRTIDVYTHRCRADPAGGRTPAPRAVHRSHYSGVVGRQPAGARFLLDHRGRIPPGRHRQRRQNGA